ncbi:MAG: glycosyltransferase family A protein [Rhabdochlamydiaceae bacterium]|nr:glycosyltransferase family A protein [Candidatus Amphrikana amoebophyrae]
MKNWFILFLALLLGSASTIAVQKIRKKKKPTRNIALNIAVKAEQIEVQKKFVVLVPSYNNSKYCKKNLESIFAQKYSNFRILYFEDASLDDTLVKVTDLIQSSGKKNIELIHNPKNMGALYNIYTGTHMCDDDEIIVILDGDDHFASDYVLSNLNAYYNNPDVWLTYGQFVDYPNYNIGFNVPIDMEDLKEARLRDMTWRTSHLRTYYAALFKNISVEDLKYEGKFLEATYDVAMMLPMIEMAREHVFFTPDVFYIYNDENPISDSKVKRKKQLFYDQYIRSKPKYNKINSLFEERESA